MQTCRRSRRNTHLQLAEALVQAPSAAPDAAGQHGMQRGGLVDHPASMTAHSALAPSVILYSGALSHLLPV